MKIIFDFDHTLFSVKKLYFALKEAFFKLGVEEKLFQETFEKSKIKKRSYDPDKQIQLIVKVKPEIKKSDLKREYKKTLKRAPQFLYSDTVWFLRKWQKKANLVLLSYGEEKFQGDKIKDSRIEKYFYKKVKITGDIYKIKPFKKFFANKDKIIFIEDNPKALAETKKVFPKVITVRINRGEGKYSKEPNNPQIDFSIKNLKELDKILNSL